MFEYFYFINGKSEKVEIEKYTRGGSKSPTSVYLIFNNKRYTPYEIKKYGIKADLTRAFNALLKKYLPERLIQESIYLQKSNYLIQKIPKEDSWGGTTIAIPLEY